MNFKERITLDLLSELKKEKTRTVINNTLLFNLDDEYFAKVSLCECSCQNYYGAVTVQIVSRKSGAIDSHRFNFVDCWGMRKSESASFRPEICVVDGKMCAWNVVPTVEEKKILTDQINEYLSFFCKGEK